MSEREWMTKSEVADHFAVSMRTVEYWIARGELPAFRVGGSSARALRVRVADLESLVSRIASAEYALAEKEIARLRREENAR